MCDFFRVLTRAQLVQVEGEVVCPGRVRHHEEASEAVAVVEEVNREVEAARSQHRVLLQQMTTWTSDESFECMRAACVFVLY